MRQEGERELLRRIGQFATPDDKRAALEIGATLVPLLVFFSLMVYGVKAGYWFSLLLLPFAAVLVTRLFTIQHDCGHGSYFSSQTVNNIVGSLLGVLTFTPYHYWKKTHHAHHAFSGNLDKRGIGDVDTFTISEYKALPFLKKTWYRLYRHPAFMLVVAPFLLYGLKYRLPLDNPYHSVKCWITIMLTNLGIGIMTAALIHFLGLSTVLLVYLPVLWLASSIGVAGFYIQHQYEDAYWEKSGKWTYFDAAMRGSSYFEFSRPVNWLLNNINLHHIHHLNGHIPSYRLRECLANVPELQKVPKRTLADVVGCFRVALWDDENKKMVGFGA